MMQPDVAIAARLAHAFQLREITFAVLEARLLAPMEPVDGEMVLDWKLAKVRIQWLLADREVRAVLPFAVAITCNGKPAFAMNVVLRVDYEVRPGSDIPPPEDIDHFVGITAFMHCWPYVRAEVQSLTVKLGVPPLTLPVIVSGHVREHVGVVARTRTEKPLSPPQPPLGNVPPHSSSPLTVKKPARKRAR